MNLIVSSSPHIRSKIRTQTIMRDVLIALLPALLAGIWVHGLRALLVTLTAAAAAVLAEGLFCMITKRNSTVSNLSSAVTGILLAMTLPASVPYWAAALGSIRSNIVLFAYITHPGSPMIGTFPAYASMNIAPGKTGAP